MAVLVYVDNSEGNIPNSSLEAVFYASKVAQSMQTETIAVAIGNIDNGVLEGLGNYGASKVFNFNDESLTDFDSEAYTKAIDTAINKSGAEIVVFPHGYVSKSVGPRLSVKHKAGFVVAAIGLPKMDNGSFVVKRTVYSGKAFADFSISSEKKIIAVQPNTFSPEKTANSANVEVLSVDAGTGGRIKVLETNKVTDKVSLSEASVVVSGGRGLKGAENWGMIEEMANLLNAATACSKPVADVGWRPHSEHVGQTGLTVRPNLYFAIGISGAIQHLAGVNGSKVIVAINTDSEAPIFKAADYGIVGDAFEVVPKLIEALKKI